MFVIKCSVMLQVHCTIIFPMNMTPFQLLKVNVRQLMAFAGCREDIKLTSVKTDFVMHEIALLPFTFIQARTNTCSILLCSLLHLT